MKRIPTILVVASVHLTVVSDAVGCAVCFGDPNSAMAKGAEAGILVLLGVIGTMLLSIVGVIVFWARRAKRFAETGNAVRCRAGHRSDG